MSFKQIFEERDAARKLELETVQRSALSPRIDPSNVDENNLILRNMRASTPEIDTYDTIFLADSFDRSLPKYMENPVVFVNHRKGALQDPVANVVAHRSDPGGLLVDMQFAGTEDGKKYFYLYSKGFMRGLSVSAQPMKDDPDAVVFWNDTSKFGKVPAGPAREALERKKVTAVFRNMKLRHISLEGEPGNESALSTAVRDGVVTEEWLVSRGYPDASQRALEVQNPSGGGLAIGGGPGGIMGAGGTEGATHSPGGVIPNAATTTLPKKPKPDPSPAPSDTDEQAGDTDAEDVAADGGAEGDAETETPDPKKPKSPQARAAESFDMTAFLAALAKPKPTADTTT